MTRHRQTSLRSGALPKREPNGRHDRTLDRLVEARSPTEVRRLRDAALSGLRAPEWGSELGRLLLQGKIVPSQYEAGRRFALLAQAFHAAMGAPDFPSRSIPGMDAPRGHTEGAPEAERHREAVRYYDEATAAVAHLQRRAIDILDLVCIRNATCSGSVSLALLKTTLNTLAAHWRIPP